MDDSTLVSEPEQAAPIRYLVPHPATWRNYSSCPWATTVIVIDPIDDRLLLVPVNCKRWGCEWCAIRKIRKMAFLTNGAMPSRMLTLTIDPALYESPKDAWEKTTDLIPELVRLIRNEPVRQWKENKKAGRRCSAEAPEPTEFEYLKVTELHKSGWPHWHLLCRSPYIPRQWLTDEWAKLTGATRIDLKKITNTFSSFRYLVKYLTKLHKIEWTDRHVSYSRNFFRESDKEETLYPERAVEERSEEHPWLYLSRRYDRHLIGVDDRGNFVLPHSFFGTPTDMDRTDVGLPILTKPQETPPPPKKQRNLIDVGTVKKQEDPTF
jgi:hypothetical protein